MKTPKSARFSRLHGCPFPINRLLVPPRNPMQNAFWLIGERVLRLGVTAVVLAMVARHLQPTGFGQLAFALGFTGVFTPLAFCGLDGLIVGELVRQPTKAEALLGTACRLRLAAGAAAVVTSLALAFGLPGLRSDAWIILPLSLGLVWQCLEVIDLWFQRNMQSRRTVTIRFATVMLGAATRVFLVWHGAPVAWFAWTTMGEVLLFELGLLFTYRRSSDRIGPWRYDAKLARELLRRSWPLAIAGTLAALQMRLDQFAVKALVPEPQAGAYFAAVRIIEIPLFAIAAIGISSLPALTASRAESAAAFDSHARCLFDLLTGTAWIVALGTTLLGPWVIPHVLGQSYSESVPSLLVLAWGLVPVAGNVARQQCILANLPTWLQMASASFGILAQGAFLALLVPRLGGPGAAVASVIATLLSGWAASFFLPGLRASATWQQRSFFIPFVPQRWASAFALLR